MGTEIKAAAIAAALGAFAGGAPGVRSPMPRARARGSASGRRLGSSGWPRRPAGRQGGRGFIAKRHRRSRSFGTYVIAFASPNYLGLVDLLGIVAAPRPFKDWRVTRARSNADGERRR